MDNVGSMGNLASFGVRETVVAAAMEVVIVPPLAEVRGGEEARP
jgi:hypothetical protein